MTPTTPLPEAVLPKRDEVAALKTKVTAPLRIVLVDDHPVVRAGLRMLISAQPDMEIVGEARDGDEAFKAAVQLTPDIIIMDLMMPGVTGLEATRQIKQTLPNAKIIGLSISEDIECVTELIGSGAEGYVLKRAAADELIAAIRVVQKGGIHLDPRVNASQINARRVESPDAKMAALTPREEAIIRLVARGYTNKEIAGLLEVSISTVETNKARAMEKAGLRNRVDIVRHGAERGWLMELEETG